MTKDTSNDERLDKIDYQLDRIVTAAISGFADVNSTLETKADTKICN